MIEAVPTPTEYAPARREARTLAFVIDGFVLALLGLPFLAGGGLAVLLQSDWLDQDPSGSVWATGYGIVSGWLLLPLLYASHGAAHGGTVGARLLGLQVAGAGARSGGLGVAGAVPRPPAPGRALLRAGLTYPSVAVLGIGQWSSVWDRQGRTLPDRLAGTQIYEARRPGRE